MLKKLIHLFKKMKLILKKIRFIISNFVFIINLLELFIYKKKIFKLIAKYNILNICICYEGGFGITTALSDRLSNLSNKKYLLIIFFDKKRFHNIYLQNFFSKVNIINLHLVFRSSPILSRIFNLEIWQKELLYKFLKYLIKKKISKININSQYFIKKANTQLLPPQYKKNKNLKRLLLWRSKKFELPLELNKPFLKTPTIQADKFIIDYIKSKIKRNIFAHNKNICIFFRNKHPIMKNNGRLEDYYITIKYLLRQNFNIFITGEYEYNDILKKLIISDQIFTSEKYNCKKDIFDFFFSSFCEFNISAVSGGLTIPTFSNKFIYIPNAYPLTFTWPNSLILYKNVNLIDGSITKYNKNLIEELDPDLNCHNFNDKYFISNNTPKEIYEGLLEYLQIFKKKKINKNNKKIFLEYNPIFNNKNFNCQIASSSLEHFV
jgi:hypothetical protein